MQGVNRVVSLVSLVLVCTGCISRTGNTDISVSSRYLSKIPKEPVGNSDVTTLSFQITNPANDTVENGEGEITLMPAAAYCHGRTKAFSIPPLFSLMKNPVQVSLAGFPRRTASIIIPAGFLPGGDTDPSLLTGKKAGDGVT